VVTKTQSPRLGSAIGVTGKGRPARTIAGPRRKKREMSSLRLRKHRQVSPKTLFVRAVTRALTLNAQECRVVKAQPQSLRIDCTGAAKTKAPEQKQSFFAAPCQA
jgi:hypothetical protein